MDALANRMAAVATLALIAGIWTGCGTVSYEIAPQDYGLLAAGTGETVLSFRPPVERGAQVKVRALPDSRRVEILDPETQETFVRKSRAFFPSASRPVYVLTDHWEEYKLYDVRLTGDDLTGARSKKTGRADPETVRIPLRDVCAIEWRGRGFSARNLQLILWPFLVFLLAVNHAIAGMPPP